MTGPVCAKCGNDGTKGALFLTIDAQYDPAAKAWLLRSRDDEGGRAVDCLACDHRTPEGDQPGETVTGFPYDATVRHHSNGIEFWIGTVTDSDGDLHGSEIIWGDGLDSDATTSEFNRMQGGLPVGYYPEGCDVLVHGPYLTSIWGQGE